MMEMRFLLLTLTACLLAASPVIAAEKTRVLLIWHKYDHPPGTHMYPEVCRLLAHWLQQSPDIEPVLSDGWPTDPAVLKGVKAVVLYTSPGGDIVLNASHRAQAEALFKAGAGLTAIHWATGASEPIGPDYMKLLGGWFNHPLFSRLETTTAKLTQTDPKHPICRGWKEYDLKDEYYLGLRFMPEAKPVLKVTIGSEEHTVGWTYERPGSRGGRSYGLVLGHFHDNFQKEAFRKLVVNGILWTAHRPVPAQGAPVRGEPAASAQ
jgi:type 1 glutamine amidotransferase